MDASSAAGCAASKIAPQVGCAAREILVPAKLVVEGEGHKELLIADCRLSIDD
jgi:hypothetical protein